MTQAGETDHDKELQKAFAEFKESLRQDAHGDTAQKLSAPEIVVAEPRRPAAPQPKIDTRPVLGSVEPHIEKSVALAPVTSPSASQGRRKGLLYLSAAIIVTGLTALGWTLTHGSRPSDSTGEPTTAAVAPETSPATEPATAAETPAPTTPATAETVPPEAPQTAAAPTAPASEQPPAAAPQPAAEKAALTPAKEAAPTAPPAPAATAQTPVKTQSPKPAAKEATTAPAQADDAAPLVNSRPTPKPAAKPKVAKTKPKPAPTQSASRPTAPAAEPTPAAAPVAEAAPPAPPPQSDGALGFVKRTVNSVGSTITNFGRSATGN